LDYFGLTTSSARSWSLRAISTGSPVSTSLAASRNTACCADRISASVRFSRPSIAPWARNPATRSKLYREHAHWLASLLDRAPPAPDHRAVRATRGRYELTRCFDGVTGSDRRQIAASMGRRWARDGTEPPNLFHETE
jgi:hypothetical protein